MPTGLGDEELWLVPTLDDSANDQSANTNNGTYNGSMGTVADTESGGVKAYEFDGTDDDITVAAHSTINNLPASDFSLSVWIKPDTVGEAGLGTICDHNYTVSSTGWSLLFRDGYTSHVKTIQLSVGSTTTNSYQVTQNNAFTLSVWQHLVIVWDATAKKATFYVDDVDLSGGMQEDTAAAGTYNDDSGSGYIIGDFTGDTRAWDGRMDDFRLFDRKLTAFEITHLGTSRGVEGDGLTAAVTPVVVTVSIPAITALKDSYDATVTALAVAFSVVSTTATATEFAGNSAALSAAFSVVVPTPTYLADLSASVSPLSAAFSIPSVTASSGGITGFERSVRGVGRGILTGVV